MSVLGQRIQHLPIVDQKEDQEEELEITGVHLKLATH